MVPTCRNLNKRRETSRKRQKKGRKSDRKISNRVGTGGRDEQRGKGKGRGWEWERWLI